MDGIREFARRVTLRWDRFWIGVGRVAGQTEPIIEEGSYFDETTGEIVMPSGRRVSQDWTANVQQELPPAPPVPWVKLGLILGGTLVVLTVAQSIGSK